MFFHLVLFEKAKGIYKWQIKHKLRLYHVEVTLTLNFKTVSITWKHISCNLNKKTNTVQGEQGSFIT